MAWTTPKTWASEALTSSDLNTHLRDNMDALKNPPTAVYNADEVADYVATNANFTNVDGSDTEGKFKHTITTNGGDIIVGFTASVLSAAGNRVFFNLTVDGVAVAGEDGICGRYTPTGGGVVPGQIISFVYLIRNVTAGSHVFRLQWKHGGGSGTIYAGAGTANGDVHPQFWVREIS